MSLAPVDTLLHPGSGLWRGGELYQDPEPGIATGFPALDRRWLATAGDQRDLVRRYGAVDARAGST